MGVYIGVDDYSAIQGPCASGFHIPSKNEWVSLVKILTNTFGLANNGNTLKTYLKMPFAGGRINTTSNVSGQGSNGTYWASTGSAGFGNLVYILPNYLDTSSNFRTSNGYSIRPFRNSPVTPDSSWTVLYQGTGDAGIYHNSSLGLISISGDGSTWKTISDKNLGATTVYNDGNTLSQNNCGKYYQWGNGYGFAFSGSVTTSSSTVNASGYGPGNYYGNYIFRTVSGGWDSSNNNNLRGGETGILPYSPLKNAYIGEYVEETYLFQHTTNNILIAKSGYKIVQVIMEFAATFGTSNAGSVPFKISDKATNQTADYGVFCTYDYPYSPAGLKYGAVWKDNPSPQELFRTFSSSYWSKTSRAYIYTIREDGGNLKIGNTEGNWNYNQDLTFGSTESSVLHTIFNSQETIGRFVVYDTPSNISKVQMTVTYEKV